MNEMLQNVCAFSNFIYTIKKKIKSLSKASRQRNDFEEKNEDDICHVIFFPSHSVNPLLAVK